MNAREQDAIAGVIMSELQACQPSGQPETAGSAQRAVLRTAQALAEALSSESLKPAKFDKPRFVKRCSLDSAWTF